MDPICQPGIPRAARLWDEVRRLTAALAARGAQKIILFGSLARGRVDLFTDIDLLVIMDSPEPFIERLARIYREVAPEMATDLLVYTPAEFQLLQEQPFARTALKEGRVLYEKAPN